MHDATCTHACILATRILVGVVWLQVVDNQVVMVRTKQKEGHFSLQIGAHNNPKLKNVRETYCHVNVTMATKM